jgi:hypothetical protein
MLIHNTKYTFVAKDLFFKISKKLKTYKIWSTIGILEIRFYYIV